MKVRITIVSLILAATTAFAADSPLRQLDYLSGNWTCKGTAFAMPDMPEHATSGTIHSKWIMGGSWLEYRYDGTKTKADPHALSAEGFLGWDSEVKKFVLGGVCSDGCYSTEQSSGWEGDDFILTGPNHMNGSTVTGRDEFRKISANELRYTFQLEMNGKWQKVMQETCKRTK